MAAGKGDAGFRFPPAEREALVEKLRRYCAESLQQELGRFDAEFLLDFIAAEMGAHFYNQGVRDAQAALAARIDDLQDVLYQLEKPCAGAPR